MTEQTQKRWSQRPEGSTWGDFGADDQLGRMNLITPEKRLAALREAKEGKVFILSLPLDYPGGEPADSPRKAPKLFSAEIGGNTICNMAFTEDEICCDDGVVMSLQYSTQWDSLAHWGRKFDVDGSGEAIPVYYNGFRAGEDILCGTETTGPYLGKLGIEKMAETGVQGRGVLINLVKPFGTERSWIDYDMLMRAIDEQGVEIREGDMVLLYTGYGDAIMAMNKQPDDEKLAKTGAVLDGNDRRILDWIDSTGISALISDNQAVEGFPEDLQAGENGLLPLHDKCLFRLGVHLGELWWLKELAEYLGSQNRHAFLLTAPPLRLPGAAGSPATPVATV